MTYQHRSLIDRFYNEDDLMNDATRQVECALGVATLGSALAAAL